MRRSLLLTAALVAIAAATALAAVTLLAAGQLVGRPRLAASRSLTPAAVARAFALSYGRYLDGEIPASQLAYSTPAAVADAGPRLRPAARLSALELASLTLAGADQFAGLLRNRSNTVGFTLTLSTTQPARVIALASGVPEEIQASPPPPAPGEQTAEQVAAAFLRVYVPLLYGQAQTAQLPAVTPGYRAELERTFHVPAGLKGLPAHLVGGIVTKAVGAGWQAWTSVNDSQEQYVIAVDLLPTQGRWLVSNVTLP